METNAGALKRLAAEMARLQERRDVTEAEAERAAGTLEELSARRAALVAPTESVPSDEGRAKWGLEALIEALDEEAKSLSHIRAAAEEAVRELGRLLLEVEIRYREEEKRLAWRRFEALSRERYSLDGEAEEAVSRLTGVLDRLEGLHADQVRAANDAGNPMAAEQDPHTMVENWLARRLREWLPNGSLEKYDAQLYELDPLAGEPEQEPD